MFPLGDTHSSRSFPFMTTLLIVLNSVVFVAELFSLNLENFIIQYALTPALVDLTHPSTFTPFISAIFLHGGFLHILSNMWFLWIFGDNVESRLGGWFIPFFLTGGLIGNLLQYFLDPSSPIPILGASGAVAAVLGAYIVLFPRNRIKTLVPFFGFITVINIPATIMLFYWLFIQIFNGAASVVTNASAFGGVAWFAHIGGFVGGWLAAQLFNNSNTNLRARV